MRKFYKPEGYGNVTPYMVVNDAESVIHFSEIVFDAEIIELMKDGDRIMHAEFKIGDSVVMIGNAREGSKLFPAMLYLYVENTDSIYNKALAAGAKSVMVPQDQFYGDRNAAVEDSCGNQWWIATHLEKVSKDKLEKRLSKLNKE